MCFFLSYEWNLWLKACKDTGLVFLFNLTGAAFFVFRNVPDVLADAGFSQAHPKGVFAILIVPTVLLLIRPPGPLAESLSADARLVGSAQILA